MLLLIASQTEVRAGKGKACTVPKSWGQLRSMTSVRLTVDYLHLAFEDETGTVRILNAEGCQPVLEIARTP